jgi:3-hydroxybutyryl-CoA dehydrogenase
MTEDPSAAPTLTIGVVGAGTMGAGIAQVCLQAGHDVQLFDVDHAAIERGRNRIADGLQRLVDKGRLPADGRDRMLAAIRDAHTLEGLAEQADIVIEAALEDIDLKETVFRALGSGARLPDILATNTSALSITAIAEASGHPDRVIGLHFFNPAPVMPLVEVVVGDRTSPHTVSRATQFARDLGKQPVVCRDSPGFIVNRVNRPFTLEALRMLEAEEVGVERLDRAVRSAGYPMGPFELMDLVGVDVNFAVARAIFHGFDEAARFTPSPIQQTLVDAGKLGRKTGEGFYRYEDGRPTGLAWQGSTDGSLPDEEVVRRIELAIINEAYLAVGEGVAEPADVDRAMKLGANHPYGPFERAGQLGLRTVVEGLRELEAHYGERYRIARALWDIASI